MSRELDAACARAMGLTIHDTAWVQSHKVYEAPANTHWTDGAIRVLGGGAPIPDYSTDPAAARLLEDEIERRGLQRRYMHHLGVMETSAAYVDDREQYGWELLRATPEQRARAFLAALDNSARS